MLDSVVTIFDDMTIMLGKLRKKSYENNMNVFRKNYGHYIDEMVEYVGGAESKEDAANEISTCFCNQVLDNYKNRRGKVPGRKLIDINLFIIYYLFPAIKLTNNENATLICDTLCKTWNETFNTGISYITYDEIYNSFNEKLFGLF